MTTTQPNPKGSNMVRTCSTCTNPATATYFDAGPFGAGTFYGCADHAPSDADPIQPNPKGQTMLEIRYCTDPECCPHPTTYLTTELICSRHALRWEIEGDGEVVSRPYLPCQDSCKAHLVTPERWAEIDA